MQFLNFDLVFVSVIDVLDHYVMALNLENNIVISSAEMILKLFLFHSHLGKYNSFKVAAFAIDQSHQIHSSGESKLSHLLTSIERNTLKDLLKSIIHNLT